MGLNDASISKIRTRLSLCAGESGWAPLKLTVDVECMLFDKEHSIVYWASGSRGLVVGNIGPDSGDLYTHILAEAPTPESGLFANRRGKPIPIAVGHATAIDLCCTTGQMWVGTENGLMGSVYVFSLPQLKRHQYIHLQDAVLSLRVMNTGPGHVVGPEAECIVFVGLANGTIIQFMGRSQGKVLENPLLGPRKVATTTDRKPCLAIELSSDGRQIWCACGNNLEAFDSLTLASLYRHGCIVPSEPHQQLGDVILLVGINKRGIWTVTRRSSVLRLWDLTTGNLLASYNVR